MAELGDSYAYYCKKGATSLSLFASSLNIGLGIYIIALYGTQHAPKISLLARAELSVDWGVTIGLWLLLSGFICAYVGTAQNLKYWVRALVHLLFGVPPLAVYQAPLIWIGPAALTICGLLFIFLSWRTRHDTNDEKQIPLAHSSKDIANYDTHNPVFEE